MGRSVWKGAGATLVSEGVGRGAAMGFQMIVANQLGADRFGIVALSLASAALLSPLADSGLPNLALRQVSQAPGDNDLVRRLAGAKVILAPLFFLPLAIWALSLPEAGERAWALIWAGMFYGFQATSDLLRQILRARQDARRELMARLAYPAGNLLALALVWKMHPGPSGALLALASGPVSLTLAYLVALPAGSRLPRLWREAWALVAQNRSFLLQSVGYLSVVGLATRVDAFLLERHAGRSDVGRYFAALNLVMAGGFFAQGLSSFLYPRLHRQSHNRPRALLRSAGLQGGLGIVLAAGAAFAGPVVFRTVFRSRSFSGSDELLPGLGLCLCLTSLDWLWLSILVGRNRIWIAGLNLLPLLGVKLLLGPRWIEAWGAIGMVWTTLVGQILTGGLGALTASWAYLRPSSEPGPEGWKSST